MVNQEAALDAIENQFIMEWGRMSSAWGINRTMAQIHALLLVTGQPHSMDDIITRLGISRGNASMSLRDLMDWGVVSRTREPGDRKDAYKADSDMLSMFAKVIRERKRREIDPTQTAIREIMGRLPGQKENERADAMRQRFESLSEIFELINLVYQSAFLTDTQLREAMTFVRENAPG